jgi:putative AdoMet-dependent methyltransferase
MNLEDTLTAKLSSFLSLQWRAAQTSQSAHSNDLSPASLGNRDDKPMSGGFKCVLRVRTRPRRRIGTTPSFFRIPRPRQPLLPCLEYQETLTSLKQRQTFIMPSAHGQGFNHDEEASGYDNDVRNERDPIRAAYHDVLGWVISQAHIDSSSRVLELGSGTGNLSCLIHQCGELVCVDLSEQMEAIAHSKSGHIPNRRFIKADILDVFDHGCASFSSVISTYAVHHLTDSEKRLLFSKVFTSLVPGGRAVFGDLMLQNQEEQQPKIQEYLAKGDAKTAQAIEEEFFWSIDTAKADLIELGFQVATKRFSDLSWGVLARK